MINDDDYWVNQGLNAVSSGDAQALSAFLHISELSGVSPLDEQFGVWPLKNVPDVLSKPMFDEAEGNTFVIVDTQKLSGGVDEVENCGLPFLCLFKGKAAQERRDEAPYIIQLDLNAAFTRRLFTGDKKGFGLWDRNAVMFVRTHASLETTCAHFRHFTRFMDEHGRWFHFQFWDGSLFPEYWRHFSTSFDRVARFFCGRDFSQSYSIALQYQDIITWVRPDLEALTQDGSRMTPFGLKQVDFDFFQSQIDRRLKAEVVAKLNIQLADAPIEQKHEIAGIVDGTFQFIRERSGGSPIKADACFSLALLVIIWGEMASDILHGPLFSERLLPIEHRIKLAQMTYFETMRNLTSRRV